MAEKISKVRSPLAPREIAMLGLLAALILGGLLRLTPAFLTGFPINDGGMFYTIINDLGKSNYALPAWTSYNGSTIPMAYPPLGFYLARVLVDVLHVTPIQILLWLPPILALLAIPAFYLLARETLEKEIPAALATLIFAFSPCSFSWFVMGGGLTRVLGMISLMLTLFSATKLFKAPSRKNLWVTIIWGGMTVLSHPEAIIHTVTAATLLWVTNSRKKSAFSDGLKVCAGVIAWTSLWWGRIIIQHGIAPLLQASQTGFHDLTLALLVSFYFTEEPFMTIISVLGIIGAFGELRRRKFFLPGWVILSFLIDPRSAAWVANIALAILAAIALDQIILPGLANLSTNPIEANKRAPYQNWSAKILLGYMLLYLLFSSYLYVLGLSTVFLSNSHREAMAWIKDNTPFDSRFILLTPGSDYPMRDPIQEWFPALTERVSLTTMQGQEWLLGNKFGQVTDRNRELLTCAKQTIVCLENKTDKGFDYIYLNKKTSYQLGSSWPASANSETLINSLKASDKYSLVYENEAAILFGVQSK